MVNVGAMGVVPNVKKMDVVKWLQWGDFVGPMEVEIDVKWTVASSGHTEKTIICVQCIP
jgi:hypothetical protein